MAAAAARQLRDEDLLHYSALRARDPVEEGSAASTLLELTIDMDDEVAQAARGDLAWRRAPAAGTNHPIPAPAAEPTTMAMMDPWDARPAALDASASAAPRFERVIDTWAVKLKRDLLAQLTALQGDLMAESRDYVNGQQAAQGRQARQLREELQGCQVEKEKMQRKTKKK